MPKMIFVNLAVADVEASVAFYEAIGFTRDMRFSQAGTCAAMVWSETITLMILSHQRFGDFTGKRIINPKAEVEVLLCLSIESREAVDTIVEQARCAGGKADPSPKQDHGFMYGRSFEDLDGHIFEPMWMNIDAALGAMGSAHQAS